MLRTGQYSIEVVLVYVYNVQHTETIMQEAKMDQQQVPINTSFGYTTLFYIVLLLLFSSESI
jgi:hypothetical protein